MLYHSVTLYIPAVLVLTSRRGTTNKLLRLLDLLFTKTPIWLDMMILSHDATKAPPSKFHFYGCIKRNMGTGREIKKKTKTNLATRHRQENTQQSKIEHQPPSKKTFPFSSLVPTGNLSIHNPSSSHRSRRWQCLCCCCCCHSRNRSSPLTPNEEPFQQE